MNSNTPELYFFIDKAHFPYQYRQYFDSENFDEIDTLGSPDSWTVWTFRTYLELKKYYKCLLVDEMPDEGIVFFFRGSVGLQQKPGKKQFWVCMVADATWHPYSHINLFQNSALINKYPRAYLMRLWNQLNIIKSTSKNTVPQNLVFFGDVANLAHELLSEDWKNFVKQQGFTFQIPHFTKWNDYTDVDIVIGVRHFSEFNLSYNKPASKLINCWFGNSVFIGGADIALELERQTPYDYIKVISYTQLKEILMNLKNDSNLFEHYKLQSVKCAERFPDGFFVNEWIKLINNIVVPAHLKHQTQGFMEQPRFLMHRFLIYRWEALVLRFKRLLKS